MKKGNNYLFDDNDWLDKALGGVAVFICIGILVFLLYSFKVI